MPNYDLFGSKINDIIQHYINVNKEEILEDEVVVPPGQQLNPNSLKSTFERIAIFINNGATNVVTNANTQNLKVCASITITFYMVYPSNLQEIVQKIEAGADPEEIPGFTIPQVENFGSKYPSSKIEIDVKRVDGEYTFDPIGIAEVQKALTRLLELAKGKGVRDNEQLYLRAAYALNRQVYFEATSKVKYARLTTQNIPGGCILNCEPPEPILIDDAFDNP